MFFTGRVWSLLVCMPHQLSFMQILIDAEESSKKNIAESMGTNFDQTAERLDIFCKNLYLICAHRLFSDLLPTTFAPWINLILKWEIFSCKICLHKPAPWSSHFIQQQVPFKEQKGWQKTSSLTQASLSQTQALINNWTASKQINSWVNEWVHLSVFHSGSSSPLQQEAWLARASDF